MTENDTAYKQQNLEVVNIKRNPYLLDYGQRKRMPNKNTTYKKTQNISAYKRKRAHRRCRLMIRRAVFAVACLLITGIIIILMTSILKSINRQGTVGSNLPGNVEAMQRSITTEKEIQGIPLSEYAKHPTWTEEFLTLNEYSRPGDALKEVNSVFVHYTANPGTSAAQNRSYFEQQKDTHERSVSAHFIIGYEGEIIQCVPLDEIAYAVQTRNEDSVSIECCYVSKDGSFTQETYDSLIKLLQWLVEVYDLEVDEDVLRHYDCGGKKCPIYYTENENAWEQLKEDVKTL